MKKILPLLALSMLSACSTSPAFIADHADGRFLTRVPAPPAPTAGFGLVNGLPADTVTVLDSRAIRALRRSPEDAWAINLTSQKKIILWVGVGIVVAYIIAEEIEDEVAFFP